MKNKKQCLHYVYDIKHIVCVCDNDISAKSFTTPISNPKVPGSIPGFETDYINFVYL